jgi:hypothetical protein
MKHAIAISLFAGTLLFATGAAAQTSVTPPAKSESKSEKAEPKSEAKKTRPHTVTKKPETKPSSLPAATATPAPAPDNPNVDLVYGAFQRGNYKTTLELALPRAQAGDPKAMTMLGEIYSNGFGVKRDVAKAADWYKRASDAGDREAMFALAMIRLSGRGSPDKQDAVRLLASAAKLGEPKAAYNLALLYLDGQTLPQDIKRSAELLRQAADAGNPEAQYALATFYKEGTGVEKDPEKAARLLQAAALADNVDAEVEYAIALFNGTGTPRNQAAAVSLLRKAARQNSAIAQNRLAFVLVRGMGAPMDKIEGFKWHLVAKTAGKGDPELDAEMAKLSPEDRAKAEALAHRWLGDTLDATAAKGQPVPQIPAVPKSAQQPVPFITPFPPTPSTATAPPPWPDAPKR